jgi:cell division protein FtsI/penicillin-binding protein 2
MARAVVDGTAAQLADGLPAGRLAAKTGTAQTTLPGGRPADISWITLILDGRLVLTVAVEPSADRPDPSTITGGRALDVARRLLPALTAAETSPSRTPCPYRPDQHTAPDQEDDR